MNDEFEDALVRAMMEPIPEEEEFDPAKSGSTKLTKEQLTSGKLIIPDKLLDDTTGGLGE